MYMKLQMELEEYEALLVAKSAAKDYEGEVLLLNSISYVHRTMGKWDQSLECLKEALTKAKKYSDLATGNVLCSLGALYIEKGEIQTAITYLNDSLEYIEKSNSPSKVASAYGNLGKANFYLGRWDAAIKYVKTALELAKKASLNSNIMISYTCLGKIESERGNFEEARKYFALADNFETEIYKTVEKKIVGNTIEYKRYEGGSDSKEQVIRDIVHICELKIAEANFFRYQNRIDEAIEKANQAKEMAQKISYSYGEIDALLELSKCYIHSQVDVEKQKVIVEEAIEKSKKLGSKSQEAEAELQFAIFYANDGTRDKSKNSFNKCIEIFYSIGNSYSGYVANIYKGIFLFNDDLNKSDAISIMTSMYKIRELGKKAESIELIQYMHRYIAATSECVEKDIIEILNNSSEEYETNSLTETQVEISLKENLILQSKMLDLLSYLRILERSCALTQNLSSNTELKDKSQLLKDSVVYLIRVAESLNKTFGNQALIFENKIKEYRKEVETKQNILLQIMQATLSGVGVTGIFTTILGSSINSFNFIHLIILAITFVSWGILPISIYCLTGKKRNKYILFVLNIIFIILSITSFVITIIYPTLLYTYITSTVYT